MTRKKDMTTTVATPPKTATGRPKPAKLDRDGIAAAEAAATVATLESITGAEKRLTQATQIIDQANAYLDDTTQIHGGKTVTVDGNERRMKKMALSLALLEGGVAVYDATSMSRYAFYKLTDKALGTGEDDWVRPDSWDETVVARAKARKVRLYRDAAAELPELATEVIKAHARKDVATKYRDELIYQFVKERGMSHSQVAALIGRERSRVTQIITAYSKKIEAS